MNLLKKWIDESNKNIILLNDDLTYIVEYMGISCKIIKPTHTRQFYLVSPNGGDDYDWYDIINRYCIEKTPSEKHILSKIVRFIEKQNFDIVESNQNNKYEDFNLEYYKLKSKLENIIENQNNNLKNQTDIKLNIKKLYDEKIVANILIGEFLECWKWSKENKDIGLSINLINDNIFAWKIILSNFDKSSQMVQDLERSGILNGLNCIEIEIEIEFNSKFYPNYPPSIKILRPVLQNSLAHRISNSKMTQLSYWTPTRSIQFIISRIKSILNKWGKLDFEKNITHNQSVSVTNINEYLILLSTFIDSVKDDDEIDNDINFPKFNIIKCTNNNQHISSKNNKSTKQYWKPGTGYGHTGQSAWDPEEYIKLQKEKDFNISKIINKIITELQKINNISNDFEYICNIISKSLLLQYLKQQFKQCTLLEMQNRESLFNLITSLLETLATEKSIYLFDIKQDNETLYEVLKKNSLVIQSSAKMDSNNEFIQTLNETLNIIVFPMFDDYKKSQTIFEKNIIDTKINTLNTPYTLNTSDTLNTIKNIQTMYKEELTKLRFGYSDILNTNYKQNYSQMFKTTHASANWKQCQKRLSVEIPSLIPEGQLPIDYQASVFLRVDENSPMIIRALITGPHDTPYESGCFIFDIYVTPEYPYTFNNCWFINTGNNRLNPNLYAEGKVCLSILGTWKGYGKSEQWNEKTSSLLQVLMSIQSQILIDEPYFNEPSFESSIGSSKGKSLSESYNHNIRLYTMKSTIRDLVVNPKLYPQFEDVIKSHFKFKKDRIIETCSKWVNEAPTQFKQQYCDVFDEIKNALQNY